MNYKAKAGQEGNYIGEKKSTGKARAIKMFSASYPSMSMVGRIKLRGIVSVFPESIQ
jgi:hypothetical protein